MVDQPPLDNRHSAKSLLDEVILAALENSVDAQSLRAIIALFLEDTDRRLHRMQDAYARGDWPRLQQEAHNLKSAAATFGILDARATARQLDQACQEACPPRIEEYLSALTELLPVALAALDRRYRNPP